MTTKEEIARSLVNCASGTGVVETILAVFGKKARVSIPLSKELCQSPIDELDLSRRSLNGLMRDSCFTVGQLVDIVNENGLRRIRNIGAGSVSEIKKKLLVCAYLALNDREKSAFFLDMIENNTKRSA